MMKKRFLFILGMLIWGLSSAWADQVSYLDLFGQTQTVNATAITSSSETLTTGWYNIKGSIYNDNRLVVADGADVNIILEESAYFTNPYGITCNEGSSLTIWAQKKDVGTWKINDPVHYEAAMGGAQNCNSGVITINGGVIIAMADVEPWIQPSFGIYLPTSAAIGGGGNLDIPTRPGGKGHVYINGGQIYAYGGMSAAAIGGGCYASGDVIINGGMVYAHGYPSGINTSEASYGIGGGYGSTGSTVTLNYINYVSVNSNNYNGAVTFQKTFFDGLRLIDPCILENGTGLENMTLVPGGEFAVWCEDNSTLYFGSGGMPSVGGQYKGHTVTDAWTGDAVNNTPLSYEGHILPVESRYPGWSSYSSDITSVVIDPSFSHARPKSTSHWFCEMYYLSSITGLEYLNTSQVVSMYSMFYSCIGLTSLDISNFDISNLISSAFMFFGDSNLATLYSNADWKTNKLTDSGQMFSQCRRLKGAIGWSYGKENDITQANPKTGYFTGKWALDTSTKVEHGTIACEKDSVYTNETVTFTVTPDEGYRVKKVTVTGDSSDSSYNYTDLGHWTYTFVMPAEDITVSVETYNQTANAIWCNDNQTLYFDYGYAPSVGDTYEGQTVTDVWTGDNVTNINWSTPGWRGYAEDVKTVMFKPAFATMRPKSLYFWFYQMTKLEAIEGIENLNTSEVTNMNSTFYNCLKLTALDLNGFNVSKVTNTTSMFYDCANLTTIYCDKTWNIPTSLSMFFGTTKLVGAVPFVKGQYDASMANPVNGYFTGKWDVSIADDIEYGAVECAQSWAYTNEMLTITVTPDDDYRLYGLIVKGDRTGKEVVVTMTDDNSYTFVMPAEAVTVSAVFKLIHDPFALWCDDSKTLYFDCGVIPQVGDAYDGHQVSDVWSGNYVTATNGAIPAWWSTEARKVVFTPAFADVLPNSCAYWFYRCSDLEEIEGLEYLNTSEVTSMADMFRECRLLKTIDVNNFDMTNVTDVSNMFLECSALTTIYCNNTWNVASSESMFTYDTLLVGAVRYNSNYQDVSMANPKTGYFTGKWALDIPAKVGHGTIACEKDWAYTNETVTFTVTPDEGYRVKKVTVTGDSSDSSYNYTDLGDWTYSFVMPAEDVTVSVEMYNQTANAIWCDGNQTLYFDYGYAPSVGDTYEGQTVTDVWTGDNVTNINWSTPGWRSCAEDVKTVVFKAAFATMRPKSLYLWFYEMTKLEAIEGIENLNTSEATNMNSTFYNCLKLTALDLNGFDVSKVTNTTSMFYGCANLTTIYCDKTWDIPTSLSMFYGANKLVGAVPFVKGQYDASMANPVDGYFTGKWDVSIADDIEYGAVECAQSWAYTNEMVTITVTPDPGYELESISIETVDGNAPSGAPLLAPRKAAVDYTPGDGEGVYTFTMPAAPVTVNATFRVPVITAVEEINVSTAKSGQRYNLMGQPVGKDYRGIVIENGQKRVIK